MGDKWDGFCLSYDVFRMEASGGRTAFIVEEFDGMVDGKMYASIRGITKAYKAKGEVEWVAEPT